MNILVTGGAGYIGAHTVLELIQDGHKVSVVDDFSTGKKSNLPSEVMVYEGDFADQELLKRIFTTEKIDAVCHLAASIEVGESFENPRKYLTNNVLKTGQLINIMLGLSVNKLIFASSAGIYGYQAEVPISEDANTQPANPYGDSKLLAEQLISYHSLYSGLKAISLRFFNACGSAPGSNIFSNNTTALLSQVLLSVKNDSVFHLFGDDHLTPDGTCIRDLIHVQDVARAHVLAVNSLGLQEHSYEAYNVGTGQGSSVKEVLQTAENVLEKKIHIKIEKSRKDEVPVSIADTSKIIEQLGFETKFSDLETIIKTSLQ